METSKPSENQEKAKSVPLKKENFPEEVGGPKGPEPTRYGDWEIGSRCSDF